MKTSLPSVRQTKEPGPALIPDAAFPVLFSDGFKVASTKGGRVHSERQGPVRKESRKLWRIWSRKSVIVISSIWN